MPAMLSLCLEERQHHFISCWLYCAFFLIMKQLLSLINLSGRYLEPKAPPVLLLVDSHSLLCGLSFCKFHKHGFLSHKTSWRSWEIWKSPFLAEHLKKYTDNKFLGPWPGLINQSRCVCGSRNCHSNISMKPTWSNSKTRNLVPSTYRATDFLPLTRSI